jgi:hypothetical protein
MSAQGLGYIMLAFSVFALVILVQRRRQRTKG